MSTIGNGVTIDGDNIICHDLRIESVDQQSPLLEVDRISHKLILRNCDITGIIEGSVHGNLEEEISNLQTSLSNHVNTGVIHRNYENGQANTNIITSGYISGDYYQTNATNNNIYLGGTKPTNNTGASNIILGKSTAIRPLSTGADNIFIGHNSGANITTGLNNICLGSAAGDTLISGDNNLYIAADAILSTESNQMNIFDIYKGHKNQHATINEVVQLVSGAKNKPSYSFTNETTSGFYLKAANNIACSIGNDDILEFQASKIVANKIIEGDIKFSTAEGTTKIKLNNGTSNSPSYTFSTEEKSGIYKKNTNHLSISINGNDVLEIKDNKIIANQEIECPNFTFASGSGTMELNNGSKSLPSLTFISDTDTGLYRDSGTNEVRFSVNNDDILRLSATNVLLQKEAIGYLYSASGGGLPSDVAYGNAARTAGMYFPTGTSTAFSFNSTACLTMDGVTINPQLPIVSTAQPCGIWKANADENITAGAFHQLTVFNTAILTQSVGSGANDHISKSGAVITIKKAGVYLIGFSYAYYQAGTTQKTAMSYFELNNTTNNRLGCRRDVSYTISSNQYIAGFTKYIGSFAINDTIEPMVIMDLNGTFQHASNNITNHFLTVVRLF
jgi:hypothetical protein